MEQEDKKLLLKDISARLPYNCRVFYEYIDDLDGKIYGYSLTLNTWCIDEFIANKAVIKPYLRPLSSITDEEIDAYTNTGSFLHANGIPYNLIYTTKGLFFLLNNHFDIFDLISKGLAIAITEENNPYKD